MTRKHTNNRMQKKPNNFGLKYGNQNHNEKAEWINNIIREPEEFDEGQKVVIYIDLLKMTLKNIKLKNARP